MNTRRTPHHRHGIDSGDFEESIVGFQQRLNLVSAVAPCSHFFVEHIAYRNAFNQIVIHAPSSFCALAPCRYAAQ
jgi:hypothetical protein